MIQEQVTTLATIMKNEDINQYAGDGFWSIIKAVSFGDIGALADSGKDVGALIFHMPTVLFWDKMQRYMFGCFKCFEDQTRMAGKFYEDNKEYEKFVKTQMHLIDEINDDKKVDYFAQLTRCYLLTDMEAVLFYKLARFLTICTPEELEFISCFEYEQKTGLTAMVSSLYQYGLFVQETKSKGGVDYVLSDFAKALKDNSLNFDDGAKDRKRILGYGQIKPLSIVEPVSIMEF